jgi:hypothetical protein
MANRSDCSPLLPPTSMAVPATTIPGVNAAQAPNVLFVGIESRMSFGIRFRTEVF